MDLGGFFRERSFYAHPWAVRAYRGLRTGAEHVGLQVVLKTFYSPIPDLATLPPEVFDRVSDLPGIHWSLDEQLAFLEERLAGPMATFDPPASAGGDPHRYGTVNGSYSHLDAAALFAMVTTLRPRRIVELGSGHSSLVTAEAVRAGGRETSYEIYDPYPSLVRDDLPGLSRLHRLPAQDVPLSIFEALREDDILFVDTTHTVKVGSDVNFIVLEVLPRLAPGVVVHIHDVFLPREYPAGWLRDYGLYWGEQYLLQAFLTMNPDYEVLLANSALSDLRGADLRARLPSGIQLGGSAFWIRRAGAAAARG